MVMMYVQTFGGTTVYSKRTSPTGDEGDSVVQLVKKLIQHSFAGEAVTSSKKIKNGDMPFERHYNADDESLIPGSDAYFLKQSGNDFIFLEEFLEERTCQNLAKQIEHCLSNSKKSQLHCQELLIPQYMSRRIARDVLRMAANEPCGLRGAVIYINLEHENTSKKLGKIVYDSSVIPTFELTLVFKQDDNSWPSLSDFFAIGACFSHSSRRVLKLSPGFRLVKKKLYSSVGPIVEEC
ncbi:DNA damage-inducible transcript 4-like protein-like [Hemiscyllium ocellatum]|uniref:DNA damage-inducible transcript 4-like protein-like n=1 Tax=Hemiscyllium ocellatum TaxID=170820 RepID=UPI0029672B26|nr:DNA damage-inducible transcript 4-like protein-like [Hemiscyllium ocellatum]